MTKISTAINNLPNNSTLCGLGRKRIPIILKTTKICRTAFPVLLLRQKSDIFS